MNKTLGIVLACVVAATVGSIGTALHYKSAMTDRTSAQTPPDIASLPLNAQGAHGETPPQGIVQTPIPAQPDVQQQVSPFGAILTLNDTVKATVLGTMKDNTLWDQAGSVEGVVPAWGLDGRVFVMRNDHTKNRMVAVAVMNQPYVINMQGDKAIADYIIADVDCKNYTAQPLLWFNLNPGQVVAAGTDKLGVGFHPADLVLATKYFCTH
jgi:hypothetical protein